MRAKDKRTATENVGCSCFIVQEKNSEKPHRGVATTPSPHPLVRSRVNFFSKFQCQRKCLFSPFQNYEGNATSFRRNDFWDFFSDWFLMIG